ncbi:ROK family transcriptional regulator [Vibrio sp. vnigr-6D03]|uniref:ROK family transcriptional regulator n=1 Tax=Vibrio sp. vnigr-6D03 TaxID=2058088 RepID=UPI000C322E5C|nr:ROK family transcriptional regulator [Vibrio sp. vnigr-6D03]PKF77587.1 ROK family transcriptional regulator [Vibrio sp. vnigr-6D03]
MKRSLRGGVGVSMDDVQSHNKRVILTALHQNGSCSRKEISQSVGLDQATVTRAIKPLIEEGIIVEIGTQKAARGRRSIDLGFNEQYLKILSIRLQRLNFSISIFDLSGKLIHTQTHPIDHDLNFSVVANDIISLVKEIKVAHQIELLGIGVAMPGPFLESDHRMMLMTDTQNWQDFDFIAYLEEMFEDCPIYASHDAKAASLSVWKELRTQYSPTALLYVSLGQGVGSGLVIDGQVYHGSLGSAGEIGHTSINFQGEECKCGNIGCLELYCSSKALIQHYEDLTQSQSVTLESVISKFHEGDVDAKSAVHHLAVCLSHGLINIVNQLNPDFIVIGDELAALGQGFLDDVTLNTTKRLLPDLAHHLTILLDAGSEDIVHKGNYHLVMSNELLIPTTHLGFTG